MAEFLCIQKLWHRQFSSKSLLWFFHYYSFFHLHSYFFFLNLSLPGIVISLTVMSSIQKLTITTQYMWRWRSQWADRPEPEWAEHICFVIGFFWPHRHQYHSKAMDFESLIIIHSFLIMCYNISQTVNHQSHKGKIFRSVLLQCKVICPGYRAFHYWSSSPG